MRLIKILLIVLIVGLISAVVYIVNFQAELLPPAVAGIAPSISAVTAGPIEKFAEFVQSVKSQRLEPFGQVVQTSGLFKVDESQSKPIHQKAFEFTRYQYCQQVVREYEKKSSQPAKEESDQNTQDELDSVEAAQ